MSTMAPASSIASLTDLCSTLQRSEGWPELIQSLKQNESGTIDGAWGSSAALAVAALLADAESALLVVVPHVSDLESWANDLHSFTGQTPDLFPGWDVWPADLSPRDDTEGQRLRYAQS